VATLYVSEYRQLASVQSGSNYSPQVAQGPLEPPLAEYTLAIGGASLAGPTFQGNTSMVRLHCDTIWSVAITLSPVSTTTTKRLAANQTEYFGALQGAGQAVAVIANV
jgi:hypothetical protein